ncbi:OB-fold domain-containing protein [Halocatena salina]|uniref:OB-fold domain-containing protein n=1 Tax=Halocatena salina TaxID=2934340 RepID=A0A8U0A319_9EURY|nr:OB-fold domain-containing protein [Halocatena salina]UPM43236.1 OB-fold domain-containing protein [Halocatena salina]
MSERNALTATRYADGTISYPGHPVGPNGSEPVDTIDLSEHTATVVTWTTSTATPPGVREPNHLAIVEFDIDGQSVRAIGQLTDDDVEINDTVRPVYTEQLREPGVGIREPESQEWDGYRFEPVE